MAKANSGSTWTLDPVKKTATGGNGVDTIDLSSRADGGYTIVAGNGADIVKGTNFGDIIWGDSLRNTNTLDNGADTLRGAGGNDQIYGGNAIDLISGDEGADTVWGNKGGDFFDFNAVNDSQTSGGVWSALTGDTINDFTRSQGDKIDFRDLPKTGTGAPDMLQWSGMNPVTPPPYGIWYTQSGGNTYIYADANGDGAADIGIKVVGLVSFQATDFLGVNRAPTAGNDTNSVLEDSSIASGSVATNDADPDGHTLTYSLVDPSTAPVGLIFNPDGTYSFDASSYDSLAANEPLVLNVGYKINDGHGGTATANLAITVTGVNGAAEISFDTNADTSVTEDESATTLTATGKLLAADEDSGESNLFLTDVVSASGNLGSLTIDANGNYEYSVANSDVQYLDASTPKTETFTVKSIDGTEKEISFTINGVDEAPAVDMSSTSVGVVELHDYTETMTLALQDLGIFESVTRIGDSDFWATPTPTLQQLLQYDSIVFTWDGGPADAASFGNVLADYVDAGGNLILTAFSGFAQGALGRLSTDGYIPLAGVDTPYAAGTTAPLPDHDLFDILFEVDSITVPAYSEIVSPSDDAIVVGEWEGGSPLALIDGGSGVLHLTHYPVPGVHNPATGDSIELLANAIAYSEIYL